jgi:hypothetical protein
MNIKNLSLATLSCVFCVAFANAQEPSKPTYEKVVFEKDGKTYVQKSLPVYLKFSTTPDGKNYPLKSEQHPTDANPLYLDTEGVNYIRSRWAVNPETGKPVSPQREVHMELYADGLAPRTSLKFSGAPKYVSGGTVFFGKGLSFDLTPKDGVSGVKETKYALGGGYSNYGGSVAASTEGAQTLYYYSADNVGNAEDTRSSNFTIDLTAPTSSHEIVGIVYQGNILSPSTTFKLTTSDNLSGVRSVKYSFDQGSDRGYSPNISMAGLKDGEHTLYYYATDNVKNEASKKSFSFYLDLIPPVTDVQVNGDQHKSNYLYVSPRTKIGLSATDNKAGVKNIYYRIDGKDRFTYSNQFNIPNELGVHTVKYDANDNVENLAANKYLTVFMDNRAPETGIIYGKPQFFDRDTLFITSQTPVKLRFRDGESGIQKTVYNIDGSGDKNYSEFTVPGEGYHTISFKSTDNVNNVEDAKTSNVFVDNTPPEIFVNFSIEPIGQKGGKNIYPNYVRMYIGATDKHTGTETLLYSVDGGPLAKYSSPQSLDASEVSKFKKKKKYEVRVVAKDKLGNESEKTLEFFVGRAE